MNPNIIKCLARVTFLLTLMLAATLTVGATPAGDGLSPAQDDSLTFLATAQHVGTGAGGQTAVSFTFTRWSTVDERDALEEILIANGMQALADALRTAPEVGFVRAPTLQATGWRLRYANMFRMEDGKRLIRAATDRPISFVEAMERRVMNWDFNVTLIELIVDDDGNGEGTLYAGVEFTYDEETDSLKAKSLSSQPVRLTNVRMQRQR